MGTTPGVDNARYDPEGPTGATLVIGIDVGGTFTDLTVYDPGSGAVKAFKAPSDRDAPDNGVMATLAKAGVDLEACGLVVHGTTVATNTLLERRGPRIAMITTAGFRDLVELGRTTRLVPGTLYDPYFQRNPPFVGRRDRHTVEERTTASGESEFSPDPQEIEVLLDAIGNDGIEAVAVCFLNSYANPEHEKQVARQVGQRFPFVSSSAAVLNEVREFERFSTCVVNTYLMPMMSRYASRLGQRLSAQGLKGPFYTIASNGGLLSQALVHSLPVRTILSGPAAGVCAASHLGDACGERSFITYDMGGTSTDVALVHDGEWPAKRETVLGGILIRVPQLDIHTIGAGGGSIAHRDAGGSLLVGPESAGANPGPASYGNGGVNTTVTDANVVLGRLGSSQRLGDSLSLDCHAAQAAVAELGKRMDLEPTEMAAGVVRVAVAKMAQAIYEVSVARGYDPRDFVLFPYGGARPLHACEVAAEIGVERIIVPPTPGAFSAYGGLCAARFRDAVRTMLLLLDDAGAKRLWRQAAELGESLAEEFRTEGIDAAGLTLSYEIDARYHGQAHELTIPLAPAADSSEIRGRFEHAFERHHGRLDNDRDIEIVNLRVSAQLAPVRPDPRAVKTLAQAVVPHTHRAVYASEAWQETPVYTREQLPTGARLSGPAVVEEMSATTFVPSNWTLCIGELTEMRLTLAS